VFNVPAGLHVYVVPPLAVNVELWPEQTVLVGETVNVPGAFKPTNKDVVAVPHAAVAVTDTVPATAPKFTVIALEFVGADVILAPAGKLQV
jgi:hypothetical protein